MKEALFICEGNVGRSQMAEGFYKHLRGADSASSAGITDIGAKYNYAPREDIVLAMKEKGIDISGQKIKQVTEHMIDEADEVVVLCDPKLLPPVNKSEILIREVPDPYESSMDGIREIRDQIERIVTELANAKGQVQGNAE
jgi:protein-tyrosine-phosphatase